MLGFNIIGARFWHLAIAIYKGSSYLGISVMSCIYFQYLVPLKGEKVVIRSPPPLPLT